MHPGKKNAKCRAVGQPLNSSRSRSLTRNFAANFGVAAIAGIFLLLSAPSSRAQTVNSAPPSPPPAAQPQQRGIAPPTNITVDASEPMFATMCALLASGFEADISAVYWRPLRAYLRDCMHNQQGPVDEVIREYYKQHDSADPGAALSRYLWFGLVAGPAPNFKPTMRREDLPPEVLALEGFSELLSKYYQEQNIHELWRQMQPTYNREIERMHDAVSQIVFVASGYLRAMARSSEQRTFTIIVEIG